MREIKFRAWDKELGRMVRVLSIDFVHNQLDVEWWESETQQGRYLLRFQDADIEQFTGLRDNRRTPEYPGGQPIYEGDKIQNKSGRICEVIWNPYHGQWDAKALTSEGNADGFVVYDWQDMVTVIGNIHDKKGKQ